MSVLALLACTSLLFRLVSHLFLFCSTTTTSVPCASSGFIRICLPNYTGGLSKGTTNF
ncbi:hypothetical protein ACG9X6_14955 [Acinetobacter guillouiae]|uniref:hypothetical protein n=1 Tax=Acinetobacter TaxID=469 RepID=UPI001FBAD248|nr:hypothetical protein [Acinetobacter sp. NyZ410]UOH19434.1 hypothetical protein MTO68_04465 [Acinetobacter sp. NyZ410]